MPSPTEQDTPAEAARALAGRTDPYLIGVRHHSPALAVALPALLDAYRPDVLLLELPAEFGEWLPWLADPATVAPVALAGVVGDSASPAFYPFADFSPELVAVRWALARGVEVVPCDLPLADRGWQAPEPPAAEAGNADDPGWPGGPGGAGPSLGDALRTSASGRPDEDMWDRVVEARSPGADPESVRRAALLVGWALRRDAERGPGVAALDLRREAWMRRCVAAAAGRRAAALVGAFHAPALVAGASAPDSTPAPDSATATKVRIATSLVPYTFALLDSRSGYPAGIRDPQWQQAVVGAAGDPAAVEAAAVDSVVRVCVAVREAGHPAGPAEAREAARLAGDLARLRGLPAPGRGELVEALQTVVAHGEVLGRGRVVAAAMERVLVGDRRGALAAGTPRSGLGPAVRDLLAELKLPGAGAPAKEFRLDPLRSDLDRRREVALRQLQACLVPYGEHTAVGGVGGADALTSRWLLHWTPQTDAMLDVAGIRGVTLPQAAAGALRARRRREEADGGPTALQVIDGLAAAAECGLTDLTTERLAELATTVPGTATLTEAIAALALLDRLRLGHIPGAPRPTDDAAAAELSTVVETVETAAVRQIDGLAGTEEVADARALSALARRADASGGGLRLTDSLARLSTGGTPMIAAAAAAVQVLLGTVEPAALGGRVASWVDKATTPDARRALTAHLTGLLAVAEPLLHGGGQVLDGLLDRVDTLADTEFLARLPALRAGFAAVSPAGRDRLLTVIAERLGNPGGTGDIGTVDDPEALLMRVLADRAGREALAAYGLAEPGLAGPGADAGTTDGPPPAPDGRPPAGSALSTLDRWRLVLGRASQDLGPQARRYATALDELYGAGRGEGSRADAAARAGRGAPYPDVREWAEELSALFGVGVREEVLARAVEAGRADAALQLDPDAARPSVELLQTVLSLAGGMPESSLARLRPLVARIVAELTRQLATRLRPALSGLATPRPTRRPGGRLDLPRTLRANLATARRSADGRIQVVPERPVFRTRARRSVDWRLVLVVDVSGSMEASVIWSALTASVLAGVPALTTHFVAFSTEVVDLSDRVDDPLGLLLEVRVGGGTHIAAGLRYARSLVTVPARTMVVVVSDFEEGYPVGGLLAEARALVESGAKLLGCASLDDAGRPRYSVSVAGQLVGAGMPIAALSPLELARWVGEQVT